MQGVLKDVELNQRMTEVCRTAVRSFVEDRTDKDGRVSVKSINKFAQMAGFGAKEPWNTVIKVGLTPDSAQIPPPSPPLCPLPTPKVIGLTPAVDGNLTALDLLQDACLS